MESKKSHDSASMQSNFSNTNSPSSSPTHASTDKKSKGEYSSPKKRLLEARRQDEIIEKETIRAETEKAVKKISEELWTGTIQSLLSPVAERVATQQTPPKK